MNLTFLPLTPENWKDFETLFGPKGACAGCWCMWFRLTRAEFEKQKGAGNKRAMKKVVNSGEVPGIIAYADGEPVGWCSVAPREVFTLLQRSRILKPVDEKQVWSVVCFFVDKAFRHQGVSVKLLKAAIEYVRKQDGKIVEGYAIEPKKGATPDVFAYHGLAAAYRKAGFKEVLRRSPTRPIMRYVIRK